MNRKTTNNKPQALIAIIMIIMALPQNSCSSVVKNNKFLSSDKEEFYVCDRHE